MAIRFKKENTDKIIHDDDSILTTLYGKIKVVNSIDENEYTYFDTVDGYNLFVSNNGDNTLAVKEESLKEDISENTIESEIEKIKSSYEGIDKIEFAPSDNAIIIKVSDENKDILDEIKAEYSNNNKYNPNKITSTVLFLDVLNNEIQLEEDNDSLLDKMDDNAVKDLAKKTGAAISGNETIDELKGIVKGALTQNK